MSRRIVITGASGMLGGELMRELDGVIGLNEIGLKRAACDITDREALLKCMADAAPDVIIHLAAFTKVNECQRNPERAHAVNSQGSRNVADAANAAGARLVYISTDYVFDGRQRTPYLETDPVSPVNTYGLSKAAGERHASTVEGSLILRCGWLFGDGGRNFVGAIRDQIRDGVALRVVQDQRGTPIWTRHLARCIARLLDSGVTGILHAAASGECSWHEFATAIVEITGAGVPVEATTTETGPGITPRPSYSVLSDARLCQLGFGPLPHWREGLTEYLHPK